MQWRRHGTGGAFCFLFVSSHFTNKFVLSELNFTFPTLFQGTQTWRQVRLLWLHLWADAAVNTVHTFSCESKELHTVFRWQMFVGAALLLLSAKLGWLEISRITRSAALPWLPASLLFVGNIYAGSKALSRLNIPVFLTLQNSSHAVGYMVLKLAQREQKMQWLKLISVCFMLGSAVHLLYYDPQLDYSGSLWAVVHLTCVGAYRAFQAQYKSSPLSDLEQQCINYVFSVLLLAAAAHPTGDLEAVLEFPSLRSHVLVYGCCASATLGFLLLLASVRLKSGPSFELSGAWTLLSKVAAICLSPFVFHMDINAASLICVVTSLGGEALLLYSDRESP